MLTLSKMFHIQLLKDKDTRIIAGTILWFFLLIILASVADRTAMRSDIHDANGNALPQERPNQSRLQTKGTE